MALSLVGEAGRYSRTTRSRPRLLQCRPASFLLSHSTLTSTRQIPLAGEGPSRQAEGPFALRQRVAGHIADDDDVIDESVLADDVRQSLITSFIIDEDELSEEEGCM